MQQIRLDSVFDPPYASYAPSPPRLQQQQHQQHQQQQVPPQPLPPQVLAPRYDGVTATSFHLGMSKMEEEIARLRKKLKKKTKEFERRRSKRGVLTESVVASLPPTPAVTGCTVSYTTLMWAGLFVVGLIILIMVIVHMVKTEASMAALGKVNDTMRLWLHTFSVPKQ